MPRTQRKNERAPVVLPVCIELKGSRLQICNISNDGIGIVLDDEAPRFFVGERLEKIPLPLKSRTVCVKGVVSHISQTTHNKTCGIQLLLDADTFRAVIQFKKEYTP